jgi:hypothetical protein
MGTRVLAASTLALASLAAGCGAATDDDSAGDFSGRQALVASTVEDLSAAASDRDCEDEICGQLLATALVDRLSAGGGNCRTTVKDALENTDTSDLTVRSVRIDGTRATARVAADTGDEDRVLTVGLLRERDRWKISRLPG